jgi:hypothetical protein
MSTKVDVEEIQTTPSERLLALVLAIFLLVGGIWTYDRIEDEVRGSESRAVAIERTPAEQAAIQRFETANDRLGAAGAERDAALQNLELRREAYRTALDAGRRAPALERAYARAQVRLRRANEAFAGAARAVDAARPAADRANEQIAARESDRENHDGLIIFLLRFVLVALSLGVGYWLLSRFRRRGSRWFVVAVAAVGYAAVLALVFAGDYIADYVNPLELGPLVLSVFGIGLTLLAFVALQRWLAQRLPARRVRHRECPYCGYPVRDSRSCEGCGREVVASCAKCGSDRRVGTLHCGACGAL